MAACSACSKIPRLKAEPSAAFCAAELRTFSKTRGTPKIRFGRERWNSTESEEKSDQRSCVAPPTATAKDTARENTCAMGKKVSTREPGTAIAPIGLVSSPRTSANQFLCVKLQPLGLPVVPEV